MDELAKPVSNPAGAESELNGGLGRWYGEQTHRGKGAINWQSASAAWRAAKSDERDRCAGILGITRADTLLMTGEMTAQEWRTVSAVLKALQVRMRPNVELRGRPLLACPA